MTRRGRPSAIRCRGELSGIGGHPAKLSGDLKQLVVDIFDEPGAIPDELARIAAAYVADKNAWALLPSAADELADLRAIAEDAAAFVAGGSDKIALRLWKRLNNFPPISRGTFSTSGAELLALEGALNTLCAILPRPLLWQYFDMAEAVRVVIDACERGRPPSFTKRHETARARLVDELARLYWCNACEPTQTGVNEFVRSALRALGVPSPKPLNLSRARLQEYRPR
ncbi:MAG: hypothetical protein J0L65_11105 [Xanthomonadales bacterium]|nr:hypothetical protein [Xanthomonadales bacterium]